MVGERINTATRCVLLMAPTAPYVHDGRPAEQDQRVHVNSGASAVTLLL